MAKRGPKLRSKRRRKYYERAESLGPTAQILAKRVARFVIAGVKPDNDKVDLRLASSWLGVLYAAGIITQEQFDAGQHYHRLWHIAYPQGFPNSALNPDVATLNGVAFQSFSSGDSEAAEALKIINERVLKQISRKGYNLVVNICAFDRFEQFIDTSSPRPADAWRSDAVNKTIFIAMLDALVEAFGFHAKQKIAA